MTGSADQPAAGMGPDDPRLSEWIDGRLDPAAADEVQRAVRAAPELSRLVEELRSLKAALAGHETAPPAAGFVRDVMAALASADGGGKAAGPAVEAEWRRLEEERIAEERAEAYEDAVEPPQPPVPRWGWLAIAGALAAGLLVAALVNMPHDAGREVAMTAGDPLPPAPAGPLKDNEVDLPADDLGAGAAAPPAEQLAAAAPTAAPHGTKAAPTDAFVRDEVSAHDGRGKAEKQVASARALAEAGPQRDAIAGTSGRPEGRQDAVFKAAAPAAAGRTAANASPPATVAEAVGARAVVIVRVDGARGREALGRLIDAGGLRIVEGQQAAADRSLERSREAGAAAAEAEWLTVAGMPQALAALMAALAEGTRQSGLVLVNEDGRPPVPAARSGLGRGAGAAAATPRADQDAVAAPGEPLDRIAIIVVDDPGLTNEPAP